MTLWFSATAVTPALSRELQLTPAEASWLTMAVQGGFVGGTLARRVREHRRPRLRPHARMRRRGAWAPLANAAVLLAPSRLAASSRCASLTGVALAAVYPPAMKMAASWFRRQRGLALGLLIGALTLGKAVPYLITTLFGDAWRLPMALASGLAVLGGVLVLAFAAGRPLPGAGRAASILTPSAAFSRIRGARLAIAGYLGHMWELYAMWTWVGRVCHGELHGRRARAGRVQGRIAGRLPRHRHRRGRMRAGRLLLGPSGQGARRRLVAGGQRNLRGAHRGRLRRTRRSGSSRW